MSRCLHLPWLVLVLAAAPACEGGAPWTDDDEATAAAARADFGPVAAYDRRLVFLGPGEALPTAVVFDFAALSDSSGVQRGTRARLVDGNAWVRLVDSGWEMDPMREPWRLVPHGPIRLLMSDGGELNALVYRGEELLVRLEPGPTIAEHSPDGGTQLLLRQARLRLDGESVPGVLLDAQLGRSVPVGFARTGTTPSNGAAADSVAAEDGTVGDTVAPPSDATPTARAGAEAILLDNSGFYAVFAESGSGDLAWIHTAGRDDVREDARLEATAFERFQQAGVDVPTRWRITAPGAGLAGELQLEAADRSPLARPDLDVVGYVLVSGWIEDRSVRREVYGLVRHVR